MSLQPLRACSLALAASLWAASAIGDDGPPRPAVEQGTATARQSPGALAKPDGSAAAKRSPSAKPQRLQELKQARELNTKVLELKKAGKSQEAFPLAQEALRIRQELLGTENIETAQSLNTLGSLYRERGEHGKAEPLHAMALEVFRKKGLQDHSGYANTLNGLAWAYQGMGQYTKAEALLKEHREITKNAVGEQHPEYARALRHLAELYYTYMRDYEKAEPLYRQALEIRKKAVGEEHLDYAQSLNDLGNVYRRLGRFTQAEPMLRSALEIRKKVVGEEHQEYANSLFSLGSLYGERRKYAQAEPLLRQALEIQRKTLGERHPGYAGTLGNLAVVYQELGDYSKAETLCRQALKIRQSRGDAYSDHSLVLLAMLYMRMGDYAKAESLHRQAMEIHARLRGKEHLEYQVASWRLAALYNELGDYPKAQAIYSQSYDVRKRSTHPVDALDFSLQYSLGTTCMCMGDHTKALAMYRQAIETARMLYGEQGPTDARTLDLLTRMHYALGDHVKAELFARQALEAPKGDSYYTERVRSLAAIYGNRGESSKAEPLFREALEAARKTVGEQHEEYGRILNDLATLNHVTGQYDRAVEFAERGARVADDLAMAVLATVSEAQALNYAAKKLRTPDVLLSAWPRTTQPVDELYAAIWRRRGMLERAVAGRRRASLLADAAGKGAPYQQYIQTRQGLAKLVLTPIDADTEIAANHRERLAELSDTKERLERELAAAVPAIGEQLRAERRPHTALRDRLPPGAVLVDLVRYRRVERGLDVRDGFLWWGCYACFVVTGQPSVVRVELGGVDVINRQIEAWRADLLSNRSSSAPVELRRRLWEPIERAMPAGTKTVYLFPDDALTRLPWCALPGRAGGSVLLDEYALAVVPNGHFLLDHLTSTRNADEDRGVLLAVGDVAYDARPRAVGTPSGSLVSRAAVADGQQLDWPPLSGTGREVAALAAAAGPRKVVQLTGADAAAKRVLDELPHSRWAHLATHGFFADKKLRSALQVDESLFDDRTSLDGISRRTVAGRNPLVLSGLILAGANVPPGKDELGLPSGNPGILTAEAIAGLDLQKLELAVLSACETGLGDVAGGEGVYGLQRAFHIAGARNVIASLWKVDDRATAALIKLFYHKLWQEKKTPLEALREAQLAIYRHPELIGPLAGARGPDFGKTVKLADGPPSKSSSATADPRLWAAFILSGPGF